MREEAHPAPATVDEAKVGRIESKVLTGFIAALLLLSVAGGITYRMGVSFARSAQWMLHTQQARATLGDLYASISDAEAAQRNYLLTRVTDYRAEFVQGAVDSRGQLDALRGLLREQPDLQADLRSLFVANLVPFDEGYSNQVWT